MVSNVRWLSRSRRGSGDVARGVAECARLGARLSRTPHADRDAAWYVMASHVGDLGALASARLREVPDLPRPGADFVGPVVRPTLVPGSRR